ncbi:adenosine deaminase [Aestuariimicrobium kwangyangense]|uniref:adenosine deaminase n=1 Tax=Aestuariimicrobium kwangyangense TaxID=396389 RepID=UPI0003B396ED|nr:adenosine deaminase [Aestuariimicrobium kwangyangense]
MSADRAPAVDAGESAPPLTIDELRRLPKVTLHDHLDGGLRPQTVIDHCRENGHPLPGPGGAGRADLDAEQLGRWFHEHASAGSLVSYIATFEHTIAAMQTREQLVRVAREFVLDQHADGVVYAEARWAPEQHLRRGLTMAAAVEAVRDGLREGEAEVRAAGGVIVAQQILCSMRHASPSLDVADLVIAYRDQQVCGYDIAGAEDGFPPTLWSGAFDELKRANARFTIHAGEAFGVPSIWEAVQLCGAHRLGHGVRLVDDIVQVEHGGGWRLGRLASYVRDQRIPLEVCPSSNLQTGVATTLADHPVDLFKRLRFRVTVNCDNRLQSATTLSREFALLVETFGWTKADVRWCTLNAMKSAFLPFDQRLGLIDEVIKPGFEG